jgi:hypothetical protein
MANVSKARGWNPFEEWHVLSEEGHALLYALEKLWNEAELLPYFDDFQTWSIALKSESRIAPMLKDVSFFDALTRIALEKLSDLPADAVLECDGRCTVSMHRKFIRNFRARNLGIED